MGIIEFNGISSKDLGVEVETFPDYVAPEKEYQVTHVPGRNGDLVVDTKTFQNVPRSYEVSVATNGVPIDVVNAAVAKFKSSSRMPIKSLSSEIKAVQDLHGYDKPWVGGAGKNLFDEDSVEVGTAWNGESNANRARIVVPCKPSTTYTLSMHGTNGLDLIVYGYYATTPTLVGNVLFPQTFTTNSVSVYIVIGFNKSNITIGDVKALKLQLEEGSTATSYEPYENICPITGFTEANIVNTQIEEIRELFTIDPSFRGRVNFNQLAKQLSTENGYFFDNASGNINDGIANITANRSQARVVNRTLMDYKKGHKYFVSLNCEFSRDTIIQFQLSLGGSLYLLKDIGIANQTAKKLSGIVTDNRGTDGTYWGGFSFIQAQSGDTGKMSEFEIIDLTQLFGETIADYIYNLEQSEAGAGIALFKSIYPNDYYAYNSGTNELVGARDGTTYNIPFGQTVYGGHFDNKGNLEVNKIKIHIDSSYTFTIGSIRAGDVILDCNNLIKALNYTNKIICDKLITRPYHYGMPIASISGYCDKNNLYPNQNWLYFKVAEKTTPQIMKDWLDNVGGIDVVYELATPITLSITSQDIPTLLGENNIYSNCGDVSVKVEPSFSTIINQVAEWLHSASGYARLEDTYEPDYYRMAYYSESVSFENLFNEAGKATLNFICKPQRYLKSGETSIVFTEEGTIQNGTRFSSSPVLKVTTDNTQGSVSIGNHTITIKAGAGTDPITIDCELQDAWSGTTNKNPFIILTDGEFPVIDPGMQTITFDGGVQSVEVTPRWWTV